MFSGLHAVAGMRVPERIFNVAALCPARAPRGRMAHAPAEMTTCYVREQEWEAAQHGVRIWPDRSPSDGIRVDLAEAAKSLSEFAS